ncbi:MAG: 30S ribosome-binding factor RbfA [Alistipes sp.]|jgi:ribosome-binding factor A|nr:30S ribosome-binding factor RbfA [Alistipes sp.]MBQ1200480.1 30S ribosome-binding factor RbfA [Alistipes sp.]MBQ2418471.1 30S ribosome-binding factor RbfA [Alistipes sp.]
MESTNTRQQKIAKQIQKDVAGIIQREYSAALRGTLVTVTTVRVSVDLAYAKIYVSVFPFDRAEATLALLTEQNRAIRGLLGNLMRNQVKSIPELQFFIDDSLEYIENIDNLLNK